MSGITSSDVTRLTRAIEANTRAISEQAKVLSRLIRRIEEHNLAESRKARSRGEEEGEILGGRSGLGEGSPSSGPSEAGGDEGPAYPAEGLEWTENDEAINGGAGQAD